MNERSLKALLWTALIVVCGLIIRRAPLHLPAPVSKYGGSLLWGAMVYSIFVAILPKRRPFEVAAGASLFALAVEIFKLIHTPVLDSVRLTQPGQLLIGKYFSLADILAYWIAIAACAAADNTIPKRSNRTSNFWKFVGVWKRDPEFDAILAEQRRIDPEDWK